MVPTPAGNHIVIFLLILVNSAIIGTTANPNPKAWPEQFHSVLLMNSSATSNGTLSLVDLWYDWPNGRNFNIIQKQLGGAPLHDLEWNNGTSYYYTLSGSPPTCRTIHFEVGILRPDWLDGGNYLGQETVDGFLCNVWEKADFLRYYEDVATARPVHWLFHTGRSAHVMTFEVGAFLEDAKWQAPSYCFGKSRERRREKNHFFSDNSKGLMQKIIETKRGIMGI